jgi:hypothetical protein
MGKTGCLVQVQELNAYTRGKRTSTGFLILNQCWTCIGQLKDFSVVVGSDPSKHLPLLILLLKNGRFSALE